MYRLADVAISYIPTEHQLPYLPKCLFTFLWARNITDIYHNRHLWTNILSLITGSSFSSLKHFKCTLKKIDFPPYLKYPCD